jgi:hypothetical protein
VKFFLSEQAQKEEKEASTAAGSPICSRSVSDACLLEVR